MMIFIISFFSVSPLHVCRRLPYIIKDDSGEGRVTNPGSMEKLSEILAYAVHFVLTVSVS